MESRERDDLNIEYPESLKQKLLRPIVIFGAMFALVFLVSIFTAVILYWTSLEHRDVRTPIIEKSTNLSIKIVESTMELEYLAISGEGLRREIWRKELWPGFIQLKEYSRKAKDQALINRIDTVEFAMRELEEVQRWLEDISISEGTIPARSTYFKEIAPIFQSLEKIIPGLIESFPKEDAQVIWWLKRLEVNIEEANDFIDLYFQRDFNVADNVLIEKINLLNDHMQRVNALSSEFSSEQLYLLKWMDSEILRLQELLWDLIRQHSHTDWNIALAVIEKELKPLSQRLVIDLQYIGKEQSEAIRNDRNYVIQISLFFIFMILILLPAIAFIVIRSINRLLTPILGLCDGMQSLAEGRLEKDLPVEGRDEIARATQTINNLSHSLKTNENKLKQALKLTEQANEHKTRFLANMSHEIRTPLNAILGFTQILLKKSENIPGMTVEHFNFLKHIKVSGKNLAEIINNVLDLSKIEAGKMDVAYEEINIKLIVQGIYHVGKVLADEKGVNFTYSFDDNLPEFVLSDRVKVNQILMNIIGNATKFTPKDGKVKLSAGVEGDELVFTVSDEAGGISQKNLEHIFEAFEQDDRTLFTEHEGTGLGLSIAKQMVTLLEGKIQVKSMEDVGSVFTVRIPWNKVSKEEKVQRNTANEDVRFAPESLALIVEDNPVNQQMLQALMEMMGVQIIIAENGKEGVEKVIEFQPDIVLMDIHMPIMNGHEALKAIRQDSSLDHIPIIMLSADAFVEQQQQVFASGKIDGYITKPIELDRLISTLRRFLKVDKEEEEEEDSVDEKQTSLEKEDKEKIIAELRIIQEMPIYRGKDLIKQIKALEEMCRGKKTLIISMLEELKQAVLEGNETRFKRAIEDILIREQAST